MTTSNSDEKNLAQLSSGDDLYGTWRLPNGKLLGEATREDLLEAANHEGRLAEDAASREG